MPNELNAVARPKISGSDNPMVVPAPARRSVISVISDSVVAKLFNYVIVKAFYPLLLMISHKFGIHFHPLGVSGTRGFLSKQKEGFRLRSYILYFLRKQKA